MRRRKYNRGSWALQRERHRIEAATPPADFSVKDIATALSPLLQNLGLDADFWERQLLADWPALVGPQVAAHTRPARVEYGVLVVAVDHSIWLNELSRYHKATLLKKLKERYGEGRVRDLRFRLGSAG